MCQHKEFHANVEVNRITRGEDGPVYAYMADLKIHCVQCGIVFRFKGMPAGLNWERPTCSFLRDEARLPIEPADLRLS